MADRYSIAAVNNALKVVALPRQQYQYNNTSFLLNRLKRATPKLSLGGRTIEMNLKVGGSTSFRSMDELESLPGAKTARWKLSTIPTKTAAAQFSISQQAMDAAKGQEKAWISTQAEAQSDLVEQFALRMSQMFYRDGTGAVARVNGAPGATSFVVFDDQATNSGRTFGFKYIEEDMDLSASANVTAGDKVCERNFSGRVSRKTESTLTVTVDPGTGDLATTDYLFIGTKNATSKNRDFMGLMGIIDDGNILASLQGIDRTAAGNEFWKGNLYTSIANADLENSFRIAYDDIMRRSSKKGGGGKPNAILTSYGVFRRFSNSIIPGRRFTAAAESQVYTTGVREMNWVAGPGKEIPLEVDRDCPKGCAFMLDTDSLAMASLAEPGWLDGDGDLLKWDTGLLSYVGVYYTFGELVCYGPNRNALLTGITED